MAIALRRVLAQVLDLVPAFWDFQNFPIPARLWNLIRHFANLEEIPILAAFDSHLTASVDKMAIAHLIIDLHAEMLGEVPPASFTMDYLLIKVEAIIIKRI